MIFLKYSTKFYKVEDIPSRFITQLNKFIKQNYV